LGSLSEHCPPSQKTSWTIAAAKIILKSDTEHKQKKQNEKIEHQSKRPDVFWSLTLMRGACTLHRYWYMYNPEARKNRTKKRKKKKRPAQPHLTSHLTSCRHEKSEKDSKEENGGKLLSTMEK
jgi:hypothetical protein